MKFLPSFRRRHLRDALVALALAVVVFLVWSWFYSRFDFARWQQPVTVGGDGLLIVSGAQAAAEGDFTPWLFKTPHRLGAPFVSDWNSWPITEEFLFWSIGIISRLTGMPMAQNIMMVAVHILAAMSFYLACRLLGKRRFFSAVFALLFGLCYYIFFRGLGHITVGYCWHIPLCWAVICFAFSKRGLFKNRRRMILALAVAVVTGLQNPYHTFIFVQFLGLACVAQALRRRPWKTVLAPAAVVALTMAVFVSMQEDTLLDQVITHRGALSVERSYMDMELYAIKPLDLLLPLYWHLPFLAKQTQAYHDQKVISGEYPMAFLGLSAVAGVLLLGGLAFRDLLLRDDGRLSKSVRSYVVPSAWILALGMAGGILGMGALLTGAYFLRAADRFSVFITLLMLFFLVDFFTSATRRLPLWGKAAVALLPLLAGAVELLAYRTPPDALATQALAWKQYGQFVSDIEKSVGSRAMLFNLPAIEFPETVPLAQEDVYAPLLLYVARSTELRLSYGDMRGDYRDSWQQVCAHLPPGQMIAKLRRYGFSGVVVSRAAYPNDAAALLASLSAATGQTPLLSETEDLAFVPLPPLPSAPKAVVPATANITMYKGWWPPEYTPGGDMLQWTKGDATMALYRDPALGPETPADISMTLATSVERTLFVSFAGKTLFTLDMQPGVNYPLDSLRLPVRPGWNLLHLRTNQSPNLRADVPTDTRQVAFLATGVRAGGLVHGGEEVPAIASIPANGMLPPGGLVPLRQANLLEATDDAGRLWRQFRGAGATMKDADNQPVSRIEFLPNGQPFCVVARVTPDAAQVESATVAACMSPGFRGFTLERQAGSETQYLCAIGDGTGYLPVGEHLARLSPGHGYLVAINVSGQDLRLQLHGDDGLDETFEHHGKEVEGLTRAYWLWGSNWLLTNRPFAGRIELVSMGGPQSAAEVKQGFEQHKDDAPKPDVPAAESAASVP